MIAPILLFAFSWLDDHPRAMLTALAVLSWGVWLLVGYGAWVVGRSVWNALERLLT